MATFPKNHDSLYFDALVRTQKAETLLAMIQATYHSKKIRSADVDMKEEISKRLKDAYNLFRDNVKGRDSGAGTYTGSYDSFESQYTIGLEMAIWKNSSLDLTDLALSVAENKITIREYLDIIFLNYVQPVNGVCVHPLYSILTYMKDNGLTSISKEQIVEALHVDSRQESVNALFNFLLGTNYFKEADKELRIVNKDLIDRLIAKCDITYTGKEGYEKALVELDTEGKYEKYITSIRKDVEIDKEEYFDEEENKEEMVDRKPRTNKTNPLNSIIYGAPGTGKTYSTAEYAVAFVEGRKVRKTQLSDSERAELRKRYRELTKNGQVVFTTFHQSYGYEDFIQGLRPVTENGEMNFVPMDGVFKRIADKAMQDTTNNYVIIIDEINRGNISKVFGELITLIEDDKRWGEKEQLSIILPSGQEFAVPNNLYIVGTMNSADKSIALIDTALRRRFEFIEAVPNENLIKDATLKNVLVQLNAVLRKQLESSDLLVGHAYFIDKTKDDLANILNRNIIPLLYEYFYDNEKKVKDALAKAIEGTDVKINETINGRIRVE